MVGKVEFTSCALILCFSSFTHILHKALSKVSTKENIFVGTSSQVSLIGLADNQSPRNLSHLYRFKRCSLLQKLEQHYYKLSEPPILNWLGSWDRLSHIDHALQASHIENTYLSNLDLVETAVAKSTFSNLNFCDQLGNKLTPVLLRSENVSSKQVNLSSILYRLIKRTYTYTSRTSHLELSSVDLSLSMPESGGKHLSKEQVEQIVASYKSTRGTAKDVIREYNSSYAGGGKELDPDSVNDIQRVSRVWREWKKANPDSASDYAKVSKKRSASLPMNVHSEFNAEMYLAPGAAAGGAPSDLQVAASLGEAV